MDILIAEDERDIAIMCQIILERRGHRVIITGDGEECLKAYILSRDKGDKNSKAYDVLILDYRMPKMDGLQVARLIAQMNPLQRVIIITAYNAEVIENVVKLDQLTTNILQKPFSTTQLLELVEGKRY